jgi:hypothetical protein
MNVIIYNRTSTKQQFDQSIHKQQDQCKLYCLNKNYIIKDIVQEYGSAYFSCPTKLTELVDSICNQDYINVYKIIVLSYDRFSRNASIAMQLIDKLYTYNVIVESLLDNIDYSTLDGYKRLHTLFCFNEHFSKSLSQRVQLYKSNIVYEPNECIKTFIVKCKQGNISVRQLNRLLYKCVNSETDKVPLEIVSDQMIDNRLEKNGLTYQNITDILNEYKIGEYGKQNKWTIKYVKRVIYLLKSDKLSNNKPRMI